MGAGVAPGQGDDGAASRFRGAKGKPKAHDRLPFALDPASPEADPSAPNRDHVGIHLQKQNGLSYVGASAAQGRIRPAQLLAAAELADRYGSGSLRTTTTQNLVIVNVPASEARQVAAELGEEGLCTVAVGTVIADRPPHRSVRAESPHTAPA